MSKFNLRQPEIELPLTPYERHMDERYGLYGKYVMFLKGGSTPALSLLDQLLAADRITNWSNAGLNQTFTYSSNIFNVVTGYGADPTGVADSTTAFNNAIAAASAGGGIVYASSGTYALTATLTLPSNVVLRGDGSLLTILKWTMSTDGTQRSCVLIGGYPSTATTTIVSGYTRGSTQLVLTSVTNFTVGKAFCIYEDNDPTVMYTTPSWSSQSWDAGFAVYAVRQYAMITAVNTNTNTITIDRPLYLTYKSNLTPHAQSFVPITNSGIEDLHIERANACAGNNIDFVNCCNCQVHDVESNNVYNAHIHFLYCFRNYAYHNYYHHSWSYAGGCGYGVEFFGATDCLAEDNISNHNNNGEVCHVGSSGNVFAYNYVINSQATRSIEEHGHWPNYNLHEGNHGVSPIEVGDYWGPSGPGGTFFRNKIDNYGTDNNVGSQYQGCIENYDNSLGLNYIGNVFTPTAYGFLFWGDTDGSILASSIIHGNYALGVQNVWNAGYTQTLPASLYKSSTPAWWPGGKTFPAFDPANHTIGSIPAKDRYDSGVYI